eukprot:IDg14560t1
MFGKSRLIAASARASAPPDRHRTQLDRHTELKPIVRANYAKLQVNKNDCLRLEKALKLYTKYKWASLVQVLRGLAGTAVALVLISMVVFVFPRRLMRRWVISALLCAQLAVIVSFFIIDGNRAAMELDRAHISKESLKSTKDKCAQVILKRELPSVAPATPYRFPSQEVLWEVLAIIFSACVSCILASRLLYTAVARATGIDDPTSSFASTMQPLAPPRPVSDVNELLSSIRVTEYTSGEGLLREKQCPICLDDMNGSGSAISMLACTHVFHEQCLGGW